MFPLCYASRSGPFPGEYWISSYVTPGEYRYHTSHQNKLISLRFSALIARFPLTRWLQSGLSQNSSRMKPSPRWTKKWRATTRSSSHYDFTGSFTSQQRFFLLKNQLSPRFKPFPKFPGCNQHPQHRRELSKRLHRLKGHQINKLRSATKSKSNVETKSNALGLLLEMFPGVLAAASLQEKEFFYLYLLFWSEK